jgi:hypothetical protein
VRTRRGRYATETGFGWKGDRAPGDRQPPIHTRVYFCPLCGETLSSPAQNYTCPISNRGFIPTHTLPRLP